MTNPAGVTTGPWTFGWTQLLTLIGFAITIGIALGGFRTFGRWKREKIEERRIEAAIDILALAYESRIVFRRIRLGFVSSDAEFKDMPVREGEDVEHRRLRGGYWMYFKRIVDHKDFFERAWNLQPLAMAIFGEQMADVFAKLHEARAAIEVSAESLATDPTAMGDREFAIQLRTDLVGHPDKQKDRVQQSLDAFCDGIERVCKPVVDREVRVISVDRALDVAEKLVPTVQGFLIVTLAKIWWQERKKARVAKSLEAPHR